MWDGARNGQVVCITQRVGVGQRPLLGGMALYLGMRVLAYKLLVLFMSIVCRILIRLELAANAHIFSYLCISNRYVEYGV